MTYFLETSKLKAFQTLMILLVFLSFERVVNTEEKQKNVGNHDSLLSVFVVTCILSSLGLYHTMTSFWENTFKKHCGKRRKCRSLACFHSYKFICTIKQALHHSSHNIGLVYRSFHVKHGYNFVVC